MIIVTGGAGLIGSAIIHALNLAGRNNIVVVDHLGSTEKWRNLAPLNFRDYLEKNEFLKIVEEGRLTSCWGQPEAIIHLGACSSTTERDAGYLVQNNFEYTKKLALAALESGIRFIYASSAATYGDGSRGFDDTASVDLLQPLNMYGYSKQLFDTWAIRHNLMDRIAGLKYFNVFGPNEYHKGDMRSMVQKAFEQISATGRVRLFRSYLPEFADGEQQRDFLYVKDAADMTLHFLSAKNANGLFNIGSGDASSWNSLVTPIFRDMGRPVDIEYIEMPESIRSQYQYYTCASIKKLRESGYSRPLTPLEDAVTDYVANYLKGGNRLGETVKPFCTTNTAQ